MNHTAELEKALTDLRHITGISMEIHAETEEEVTKALEQLKLLSSAYKEKYNKIHFLQSLMTDSIPTYNVYDRSFLCHSLSSQISGRFFTGNCTSYCPHDRGYRKRGSSGTCPCFVQQDSA